MHTPRHALTWRRFRGWLLRVARRRPAALVAGILLLAPAAGLLAGDYAWESAATDGIGLILGATGTALILAGISGRKPDWIE